MASDDKSRRQKEEQDGKLCKSRRARFKVELYFLHSVWFAASSPRCPFISVVHFCYFAQNQILSTPFDLVVDYGVHPRLLLLPL